MTTAEKAHASSNRLSSTLLRSLTSAIVALVCTLPAAAELTASGVHMRCGWFESFSR